MVGLAKARPNYSAAEDYFNHSLVRKHSALDFRNNTKPVRDKNGVYSTNLFTEAIEKHNSNKGPFFIYAAYQSVHAPLEVPQKYINQQCQSIPYESRRIFCGMLRVADEGITNITMLLQEKNLFDDTIIIFTTDNGGQTAKGSNNWPLRGN